MSWYYSGDPAASQLDECRFLIGDTKENMPIMQDEEISYLITQSGTNKDSLLYSLYTMAATIFARDIRKSLGPQSEDPTERLKYFSTQARYYKDRMSKAGLSLPVYSGPKVFRTGMQSNPPTGGA